MKISILTPSYNQGNYIEKNIQSVLRQSYDNVEHIIIDGGSQDNTVDILKRYSHLKWVSEADEGQADALNKGLAMATGDIIGWVNSDDYYKENIFTDVAKIFQNTEINWIIGNTTSVYTSFNFSDPVKSSPITYERLQNNPDMIRQQATFFRKPALSEVGGWNKQYYMTMDFDLWLRLSKRYTPKMIDKEWAFFTHHDEQKSTPKNLLVQISDIKDILKKQDASKLVICNVLIKKYFYYFKAVLKAGLIRLKIIEPKYQNIPMSVLKKKDQGSE